MLTRAIAILLLAGLATVAAAENVYKWADLNGQIHYTDRPPTEPGARLLSVFERSLMPTEEFDANGADAPGGNDPDEGFAPPDEPPASSTVAAVQRDVAQVRGEQCKQAQERYKSYVESRRLYKQTEDGKREYLSDAELSAARVKAKQDVDELCR